MDDNCGNVIDVGKYDQVRVQLSPNVAYRTLQCTLFLDTDPGSQLMVYFRSMTIPSDASCHNQYLEIHDGNTPSASYIVGLRKSNIITLTLLLMNAFDFWNVHGLTNTSGFL